MFKLVFNAAEQINTHTIIHVPYKKMFNKLLHGLGIIEFNLKKKSSFNTLLVENILVQLFGIHVTLTVLPKW